MSYYLFLHLFSHWKHCQYRIISFQHNRFQITKSSLYICFPSGVLCNSIGWFCTPGNFQFGCNPCCFVFLLFWLCDSCLICFLYWPVCSIMVTNFPYRYCIFFDNNLAWQILWYIPIFHLVAQANVFGADFSSISSNGIAKYLDLCYIINDWNEYKLVTVLVASVIFVMPFCSRRGLW